MEFSINSKCNSMEKIYNGFIYKSPLLSPKYTMQFLEFGENSLIKIGPNNYYKKDFKQVSDLTDIKDFANSCLVETTYELDNINIGTRINYADQEEILYVLYKDIKFYDSLAVPINRIIDNIYIGNLSGAIDDQILDSHNIKNVVQVFDGFDLMFLTKYIYLVISIDDNGIIELKEYFIKFIEFVKNTPKTDNIFIHCQHGSSRSGTFVLLYLMYFHNMNYENALEFAKQKRYGICPNDGFKSQLISFMDKIK
jgi:hypothetical protein